MRESELLNHIYERSARSSAEGGGPIVLGPGDDTAVLDIAAPILATTDQLIAGRHFAPDTPIDAIARKSIARAVSDIAAMAGQPSAGLAAATLPHDYPHADELFDRMAYWAERFGCPLAGGDIATGPGPLALTLTILGRAHGERGPVLRSTARADDHLYVTGLLGGSLESGRHLIFKPRLAEGAALATALGVRLTAMMDLSDGLGIDAGRLATASAVRLTIHAEDVPRHEGVAGWRAAISDGEDYELLFASPAEPEEVRRILRIPVTHIGEVSSGAGCVLIDETGHPHDASVLGWDHE